MQKELEILHERNYRRALFGRTDGTKESIMVTLHGDWTLQNEHAETLLKEATGRTEFYTKEFEQAAEFLLTATL